MDIFQMLEVPEEKIPYCLILLMPIMDTKENITSVPGQEEMDHPG